MECTGMLVKIDKECVLGEFFHFICFLSVWWDQPLVRDEL